MVALLVIAIIAVWTGATCAISWRRPYSLLKYWLIGSAVVALLLIAFVLYLISSIMAQGGF